MGVKADEKSEKRRAGKRGRRNDPVSKGPWLDRQQQAHKAVADRPDAARDKQEPRFGRGTAGQHFEPCPHGTLGPRLQVIIPTTTGIQNADVRAGG